MDGFEFKKYVIECKRVGLDNNQIAEKLGIDPMAVFKTIVMRTESKEICVFL